MSTLSHKPQPGFAADYKAQDTVLLCLSRVEMEGFFPDFDISRFPGSAHYFDTTDCTTRSWREALRAFRPSVIVSCWSTPMLPEEYVADPAMELRYVCHLSGSVKSVVPRSLLARGVCVSNWGGIASVSVAEHALMLILAALRRMPRWRRCLLAPFDDQTGHRMAMKTRSLTGQKVGIHGFGRVAQHLVRLLEPFDVRISAYSEGVPDSFMLERGVHPCSSLEELFSTSPILVECEALYAKTEDSVTADILRLLPHDATFVNVGRGRLVDEIELIRLAGAGSIRLALDVYYEEPLPHDSALLNLEDAVLSPHIAGPTLDLYHRCAAHAEANLRRFFNDEPVEAGVTLREFDRST